ncbi:MAG: MipA/OmpV family protein [Pseudomonadota bacterium]
MKEHSSPIRAGAVLSILAISLVVSTVSSAAAEAETSKRPWDFEIGFGPSYKPDYSGSQDSSPHLLLWASGEYRTEHLGTFALDSGSLTIDPELRWNFLDGRDAAFGLLLGYREGRDDQEPGLLGSGTGSSRLQGMGTISAVVDAGVQGHVSVFGVPLFAQVRRALNSEQGTLVILGAYLPLKLGSCFELVMLPTLTLADSDQMQAFYGVTPTQSAGSGFRAYEARSGWQSAALEMIGDWTISGGWHAICSVTYLHLLADAASSPLVQEKGQVSGLLGMSYRF